MDARTQTNGNGSVRRSSPLLPEFSNFPSELTSLPNWVLWRYLPPKSGSAKWRKVPFQPNSKTANTADQSTWRPFDECCAAYIGSGFDGVGFVFDGKVGTDRRGSPNGSPRHKETLWNSQRAGRKVRQDDSL
jgi:hypothetical protein